MAPVENMVSAVRTRMPSLSAEAEAGTGAPQVPAGGAGMALQLAPAPHEEEEVRRPPPPSGRGQGSLPAVRGEAAVPHEEEGRQLPGSRARTRMAPWEPAAGAPTSSLRGSLHEAQSHQQLSQQQDDRSQRGSLRGAQSQQQLSQQQDDRSQRGSLLGTQSQQQLSQQQQQQQDDRSRALEARLEAAEQLLHLMAQRQLAAPAGPTPLGLLVLPHQNDLTVDHQSTAPEEWHGMGAAGEAASADRMQPPARPLMPTEERRHHPAAGYGGRSSAPDERRGGPPQPALTPLHSNSATHTSWRDNGGTRSGGGGGPQAVTAAAHPKRDNGSSGSTRQPVVAAGSPPATAPSSMSNSVAVPLRDRLRRLADRIVGRRGRE